MPPKRVKLLELAFSASPSKPDPAPSVPGLAARADGTCAVTRHEGVCLFSKTDVGLLDTYVETRLRHREVALHPTQERFVVWTKTSAVILKRREAVVFVRERDREGFTLADLVVGQRHRRGAPRRRIRGGPRRPRRSIAERDRAPRVRPGILGLRAATDVARAARSARATGQGVGRPRSQRRGLARELVSFEGAEAAISESSLPSMPPDDVKTAAMNDACLAIGMPRASGAGGMVNEGSAALYRRHGTELEPVAILRPTRSRKYLGFGAIPSVCGERVALASLGWSRVPKSHNEFVPRVSVTSVFDTNGVLLAEGASRVVTVEEVERVYSHVQLTREHVLELDTDGQNTLRAYAL